MDIAAERFKFLVHKKRSVLSGINATSFDRDGLIQGCENFYTDFLGIAKPQVHVSSGPKDACERLKRLIASFPEEDFDHRTKRFIAERVFANAKSSKKYVKDRIGSSDFLEIKRMVFGEINRAITHSIGSPIFNVLNRFSREELAKEFSEYPSWADNDWLSFYSILSEAFDLNSPVDQSLRAFVESGIFCGFFFKNHAILVPNPLFIRRDDIGQLHEEEGAAVEWSDGTQLCFWNGIEIPNKLIFEPDSITAEDILNETNAERRRCYQEALGSKRFGSLLGLISLDKKLDRFGNELILFRTKDRDRLAGDFIYFAKVVCPSTGRIYFLCVPPGIETVEQAVSWTFGKTPEEYKPVIET